jgi:hypothetical protein
MAAGLTSATVAGVYLVSAGKAESMGLAASTMLATGDGDGDDSESIADAVGRDVPSVLHSFRP